MPLYDNLAPDQEFDIHTQSFLVLAEKSNPVDPYTWLRGVAIGEPSPQTLGAVEIPYITRVNGQITTRTRIARQETVTRWEIPVTLPPANWFRGVLAKFVRNLSTCETDIYLANTCSDQCASLYFHFPDSLFGTITPTAFTTVEEDATPVGASATLYTDEIRLNLWLDTQLLKDDAGTDPAVINGLTMAKSNCPECGDCGCEGALVGAAAGDVFVTTDGFANFTAVSGFPALAVQAGRGVSDGSAYIVPHTLGIAKISHAGTLINNFVAADAYTSIDFSVDGYLAAGDNGKLRRSTDGITWTAITVPSATADFTMVSSDLEQRISYIVGTDAGAPIFYSYQTGVVVDLSAAVLAAEVGSSTSFTAVHVADAGFVYVGTGAGEVLVNPDLTGNGEWQSLGDYGTAITGIAGDRARIFITTGTSIFERSPLTNLEFTERDNPGGYTVTGDYTEIVQCSSYSGEAWDGANYFIAGTDAGEIVRLAPCVLYC